MRKWVKLILIIMCMITIFLFSNDDASRSTEKSDKVIIRFSNIFSSKKLTKEEQKLIISKLVVPVRKSAHFIIYLILGILLISYFREFSSFFYKMILLSIFLAFLYACSDEIHQLFVPGRSGEIGDVLLDTTGAVVGIFGYEFVCKLCRLKNRRI